MNVTYSEHLSIFDTYFAEYVKLAKFCVWCRPFQLGCFFNKKKHDGVLLHLLLANLSIFKNWAFALLVSICFPSLSVRSMVLLIFVQDCCMSIDPDPAKQAVKVTLLRKRIRVDHPRILFNNSPVLKLIKKDLGIVLDFEIVCANHIQPVCTNNPGKEQECYSSLPGESKKEVYAFGGLWIKKYKTNVRN